MNDGRLERENEAAETAAAAGADANPQLWCPTCSTRLEQRKCKLFCPNCGYYMSCADYY
jgi:Zn finger protein HypA/HybF involved in hydrogenase expression